MRVRIPKNSLPVTLSNIGGDPARSRELKGNTSGVYQASDRDELQALLAVEGAELVPDDTAPDGPATAEQ